MSKILIAILALALLGVVAVSGCTTTPVTNLNITAATPQGDTMNEALITGITDPGATVTINGTSVTPDSSGKFTYTITNIIAGNTELLIVAKAPNKEANNATIILQRNVTEQSDGTTLYSLKVLWKGNVVS